ncbi:hypothetical protein GAYE_PCTG52G1272 [Galdieria yellowstonensis]|uniref:MAGE domain-containing protein n=1 Tax=Galdieria yellowstonensis TaxID=3028027 RepID=A0AAV9I7Q4_9RHOD|nr:hypothetical protein GAYE_PCTG52G1272 [Galdieria yellowstonensis]
MSQGESSIQATEVSSGSQRVSSNNREELISAVCRHLLAATGKRAVVRRDDISHARLEQVFGLKVVELGMESKSGKTPSSSQVGGASSRLKGNGPVHKGYILINTLTQDDAYDGDDEECSFFGVLTVIVSFLLISPNSRLSEEKLFKSLSSLGLFQDRLYQNANGRFTLLQDLTKMWYLRKEQVDHETIYTLGPRVFKELDAESMIGALETLLEIEMEADYRELLMKRWENLKENMSN